MEVLIFTFSSGLIAAFNPCGVLMFPAYIGYQLKSINQINSQKPVVFALFIKALSLGIFTSLGFVVLFGFMGLLLGLFGSLIRAWVPLMGLIIGVLLIVFGVFLLGFRTKINILFLSRASSLGSGIKNQNLGMFVFGIGYGIASLSCALPIYLAAIGLVLGTNLNISNIIFNSLIYALGMGVVMISTSVGVVIFKHSVNSFVSKISRSVEYIGSVLMIIAGIFITHYWLLGTGSNLFYDSIKDIF